MADKPTPLFRMAPLQRLEVQPVEDPAELAVLEKRFRQLMKPPARWRRWLVWVGAAVVVLLIGVLIGRFVL